MDYPSLNKLFLEAVDRHANPKAQIYKTAGGWESFSAPEMLRRVAGLSKALRELGIKAGDRVGVFAPNCPEWHVADFAITGLGAASVPIYFNESADRLVYILKDSGARIVFTAGEAQARKIAEARAARAGARTRDFGGSPVRPARRHFALRDVDRDGRRRRCGGIPAAFGGSCR